MSGDRWPEIKVLLDQALDLPIPERDGFVLHHCGEDRELRRELQSYLRVSDQDPDFLEDPVVDLLGGKSPEFRVGERVGAYCLDRELARGGMGVVYDASRVDGEYEQNIAVKILKRGFDTADFVRRSRQERQILARLDHPNIARLLDGGATKDGLPYLVMEKVEGVRLDHYCRDQEPTLEQRLEIFLAICSAVHQAHQNLVVHCDLKPSNILITEEGQPKLLDFGIAKVLQEGSETRTRALRLGTPGYASPEQLKGGNITTASDVYALGALLHLLLVGEAPEPPEDPQSRATGRLRALVHGARKAREQTKVDPKWFESLRPAVGDLEAILGKAMAWEPAQRYESAAELAEDLQRHQRREPISARRYTWWGDLQLLLQRHRREVRYLAAVLVVVAVAAGVGLNLLAEARQQEGRANASLSSYLEVLEIVDRNADENPADAVRTAIHHLEELSSLTDPRDVALVYDRFGQMALRNDWPDEADDFITRSLELRRRLTPIVWEDIAASLNNLALVKKKRGELDRAAELYDEALALHKEQGPFDPGELLDLLNNRARIYEDLGDLPEAETLNREVLARRVEHHGAASKEAAQSLLNLGAVLYRQGKLPEAEDLFHQAYDLRSQILGPRHDRTMRTLNNLAAVRLAQGRGMDALALYETVLQARKEHFGERNKQVALARSSVGAALLMAGGDDQLRRAEVELRSALGIFADSVAADDDDVLWAKRHLAASLLALGRVEEAETMLREVQSLAQWPEKQQWKAMEIGSLLGSCLMSQGRLSEARSLLEGAAQEIAAGTWPDSIYARQAAQRWQEWLKASGPEEHFTGAAAAQ